LLGPLKLTHTQPATQPKLDGLIQGHIGSDNMFDLPKKTVADGNYVMDPKFEWCGGGFVTNVGDLANWLAALHSGKVLDKRMYDQLIAPVDFRTGQPGEQGYGLGTFVWQTDNGLFLGHAGIMPGYLTQIEYSQDHQFAIALQTNTDQSMGRRLHKHVQELADLVIKQSK
jgi:D-alanyl-D-alanine carboxypeptidase